MTTEIYRSVARSFLFLVLFATVVQAQPENFIIGHYLFQRPAAWNWIELSPKSKIAAKLSLNHGDAEVVFLETKAGNGWASAPETIERWKKNFIEMPWEQNQQREERKVNKKVVTFFWQEGTYQTQSGGTITRRPGYAQYGVIIDDGNDNVLARVLGTKEAVEKAKVEFKQMVEGALIEQD